MLDRGRLWWSFGWREGQVFSMFLVRVDFVGLLWCSGCQAGEYVDCLVRHCLVVPDESTWDFGIIKSFTPLGNEKAALSAFLIEPFGIHTNLADIDLILLNFKV